MGLTQICGAGGRGTALAIAARIDGGKRQHPTHTHRFASSGPRCGLRGCLGGWSVWVGGWGVKRAHGTHTAAAGAHLRTAAFAWAGNKGGGGGRGAAWAALDRWAGQRGACAPRLASLVASHSEKASAARRRRPAARVARLRPPALSLPIPRLPSAEQGMQRSLELLLLLVRRGGGGGGAASRRGGHVAACPSSRALAQAPGTRRHEGPRREGPDPPGQQTRRGMAVGCGARGGKLERVRMGAWRAA